MGISLSPHTHIRSKRRRMRVRALMLNGTRPLFNIPITILHRWGKLSLERKALWKNKASTIRPLSASTRSVDILPFGIIAAVSKNGIIGVDGDLPWTVPADRKAFEDVTRDKILIVGRNTLFEGFTGNYNHLAHCRQVIVVSRTMRDGDIPPSTSPAKNPNLSIRIAPSVAAALQLATRESDSLSNLENMSNLERIHCWIGGGEGIYVEALQHPQARLLHLTVMDTLVELPPSSTSSSSSRVARFPDEMLWKKNYRLLSQTIHPVRDPIAFTTFIYERITVQ